MTMALAVAMVACTGATSVKGETGATGPQGETGPAGPAGTSDNDSPMFTAPEGMIYLAMAGSGRMTTSDKTDLSKYFKDTESPTLEYKVKESSAPDIATAEITGGKMLKVTGKTAGQATITVEAYDNVNMPVTGDFMVMVAASNAAPTVAALETSGTGNATDKLQAVLYKSRGPSEITITSATRPGVASGVQDELDFSSVAMGKPGDKDDIVKVTVVPGSKPNEWKVTLDPITPGRQNVRIMIKDKFGAINSTDSAAHKIIEKGKTAVDVGATWDFIATVNTPPKKLKDLKDKTVIEGAPGQVMNVVENFDISEVVGTMGPYYTESDANVLIDAPETLTAGDLFDAVDGSCMYSTTLSGSTPTVVPSDGNVPLSTDDAGEYQLTVVCHDVEDSVTSTATITVRPAAGF